MVAIFMLAIFMLTIFMVRSFEVTCVSFQFLNVIGITFVTQDVVFHDYKFCFSYGHAAMKFITHESKDGIVPFAQA
jgi:hypothetical protein